MWVVCAVFRLLFCGISSIHFDWTLIMKLMCDFKTCFTVFNSVEKTIHMYSIKYFIKVAYPSRDFDVDCSMSKTTRIVTMTGFVLSQARRAPDGLENAGSLWILRNMNLK